MGKKAGAKKIDAEEFYRSGLAPHRCGEVNHVHLAYAATKPVGLGCGTGAAHRYRVFWPYKELVSRWPTLVAKVIATNPDGIFPTVLFRDGQQYACVSIAYACDTCRGTIERALAKAPSWVLVEKENRPDTSKIVQVPGVREEQPTGLGPMGGDLVKAPLPAIGNKLAAPQ